MAMMTADKVISEFGGPQPVAAILGVTLQAVCNMKTRNSISPKHWGKLVSEAKKRRKSAITFENLAAMKAA